MMLTMMMTTMKEGPLAAPRPQSAIIITITVAIAIAIIIVIIIAICQHHPSCSSPSSSSLPAAGLVGASGRAAVGRRRRCLGVAGRQF
jgi:putative component of membrane protein insertase Oxa1/YidC/SpoIIIJ protein YidD